MSQSPETFEIKIPQFEGPFDLLLFFIERDELDIHHIAIAKITDDFLEYIHTMTLLNMELASEFIFVAATLMRIKSRMLLPRFDQDGETEGADIQEELIRRLVEYKKFKEIAESMKVLEERRSKMEKRGSVTDDLRLATAQAAPGEELSSFDLYRLLLLYDKLINRQRIAGLTATHTVIQYPYSIELQKEKIAELLEINQKIGFAQLAAQSENKVHFVYNFLALLEMLQQQLLSIQIGLGFNNFWAERPS